MNSGSLPAPASSPSAAAPLPEPAAGKLPRWRGFNLQEKFIAARENTAFRESDFAWLAEWGFNFVRLPLSYHCWSDPRDWRQLREPVLREIDQAVAFGRQYGLHVCLNFHRAPGYSVDTSVAEPFDLWTEAEALEACAYHWGHFAERYRGVPNSAVSFDLLNEPGFKRPATGELLDDAPYVRVVHALVAAIRERSPERLIIADGLNFGRLPVPALAGLGIAQSTRGYDPMEVSHWQAGWIPGAQAWPCPAWPLPPTAAQTADDRAQWEKFRRIFPDNALVRRMAADPALRKEWNRDRLRAQLIRPWQELEALGVGVHVGEFGAHNRTPHAVALAWLRDLLGLWREAGWGWAQWTFRGSFGILDSERADVRYDNFHGHQLDRAMLELLREF